MANVTIALEENDLRDARIKALQEGTSFNAVIRDFVAGYVGRKSASEGDAAAQKFLALSKRLKGRSKTAWTREELYDRPVLRR